MGRTSGPVYEVTFDISTEIADRFDAWLDSYLAERLRDQDVHDVDLLQQDDVDDRSTRVLRLGFADDAQLDLFVTNLDAANGPPLTHPFEDEVEASVRILRPSGIPDFETQAAETCANCGTALDGQYCGHCGQRAASRLISLWELVKDAFGDLLEFDSRLWRTLIPLTIHPGKLTRDYLRGKRARYMPPFRMYLVMSIVFFVVAFFDPTEEFGILFEEPVATESEQESAPTIDPDDQAVASPSDDVTDEVTDDTQNIRISMGDDFEAECEFDGLQDDDLPTWLASRMSAERLILVCNRIVADDGRAFLGKLLDNVPVALFILLPVMALILKALYPLSRRYYVEHLLFVVHYHAFVFLVLSLDSLFSRLGGLAALPELPFDILSLAVALYVPVYLYLAQLRVYEQGRLVTSVKFAILAFAYFVGLLIMFGLAAIFAAFAI